MTNIMSQKSFTLQDILIIVCLIFAAFASLASDSTNSIALYFAIPMAFIVSFLKNKGLRTNKYNGYLMIMYVWVALSSLWATNSSGATQELHQILGVVLLCYIMAANAKSKNMIMWLYLVFVALYLGAWNYAATHMLVDIDISSDMERMNDEKLNANTMAYYTFFITYIIFIFGEMAESPRIRKILRYTFFLTIPMSFYVALVTASRQVLVMQVPLIIYFLYSRYFTKTKNNVKVVFVLAIILGYFALNNFVTNIYESSFLKQRSETALLEDSRWLLAKDAFEVGCQHWLTGVGAGNYVYYSYNKHFSHNTFLELFANTGIIGVSIYIYVLFVFLRKQWKQYRDTKDKMFLTFFIFGVAFFFDQFFYVYYTDLWLMSFFVLVATHSESYYQSRLK